MTTPTPKPFDKAQGLRPEDGALNTIVAHTSVKDAAEVTTKGKATYLAVARLARDVGAAVLSLALEHKGTLELQLTVHKTRDEAAQETVHEWRVDVWKARQRQYLRVPVRKPPPFTVENAAMPPPVALADGTMPGVFHCAHCGTQASVPAFEFGPLPRRKAVTCGRCSLPVFLLLVDGEAGETNRK